MCDQTTSGALISAICSRELEGGATPSGWPDGEMSDLFGLPHVPVSRFRALAKNNSMPTKDTSGPLFTASSPSAALQWSLGSKLRTRLERNGSPPFVQTWKQLDMPAGPPLCRLSVSAPPIDGTEHGSLHTPSGTSNHGKNHVSGRLDEWGGSANNFRGQEVGKLHLPGFELWMMGYPGSWRQLMPLETRSFLKSRRNL